MKKLFLLDGHAIIHRAFHGVPPLNTPDGTPTNALYGFISMTLNMITQYSPDYLIVAFDRPEKTFRHEVYAEYKANRASAPDELRTQFPLAHEFVVSAHIAKSDLAGYEADDILGTLAKQAEEKKDILTTIVTGDKDCLQLISEKTEVLILKQGLSKTHLFDTHEVEKIYELRVDQLRDLKALTGDPSDNLKGIIGIGPKIATTLLKKYQTLEGIFAHADELSGHTKEKIKNGVEEARQTRFLGTIKTDAPLELNLDEASIKILILDKPPNFQKSFFYFH